MSTIRIFYVMLDHDSEGLLHPIMLPERVEVLERAARAGLFPVWNFGFAPNHDELWAVRVYAAALEQLPSDQDGNEIHEHILAFLQQKIDN